MKRAALLFVVVTAACGSVPDRTACPSDGQTWLAFVNHYRVDLMGIQPIVENADLTAAAQHHTKYMVDHNSVQHFEDPSASDFTEAGNNAAKHGGILGSSGIFQPLPGIESLITTPWHGMNPLYPLMKEAGFGYATDCCVIAAATTLTYGAVNGRPVSDVTFPVTFPGDGKMLPPRAFDVAETPDPFKSCPDGYGTPAGHTLFIYTGFDVETVVTGLDSLTENGAAVEHCTISSQSVRFPGDQAEKDSLALKMKHHGAVVLIPRHPLNPGSSCQASVEVNGKLVSWSFTVGCP